MPVEMSLPNWDWGISKDKIGIAHSPEALSLLSFTLHDHIHDPIEAVILRIEAFGKNLLESCETPIEAKAKLINSGHFTAYVTEDELSGIIGYLERQKDPNDPKSITDQIEIDKLAEKMRLAPELKYLVRKRLTQE